jgi:hypothetical protein
MYVNIYMHINTNITIYIGNVVFCHVYIYIGMIPPHLRKAMALRNKMRGGGTTIGALDAHQGPNYSGPQTGIYIFIYLCIYLSIQMYIYKYVYT